MDTILITFLVGFIGSFVGIVTRMSITGRYLTWVVCSALVVLQVVAGAILIHNGDFSWLGTFISIIVSVSAVLIYRKRWQRTMVQLIVDAPALMTFALGRFSDLDVDGDGNITLFDLWYARDKQSFSPAEEYLLKQMEGYLWLIGHIVHTTRTMSPMTGTVAYLHSYGASRSDLNEWSLRALDSYERDFSF